MTNDLDPSLTGAAFDLANAGYTPMNDPEEKDDKEEIGSDNATLRQAANKISVTPDSVISRAYLDESGKPIASSVAITLERAARDYAGMGAAERLATENETSKALADRVDALRVTALANNPDAADFYGFDLPENARETADNATSKVEESEKDPIDHAPKRAEPELDPQVEEALQHPQVRHAIEQKVGEAEKARQDYRDGLAAATRIAQLSFLSQFPELAGIAPENLPHVLSQIARQDPTKLGRIQAMVAATERMFAQKSQENERQAQETRQHFAKFAQAEDQRLETMLKGEPSETRSAVANEIMAFAKDSGVDPAELSKLFQTEPLMRNATFQRMMYDAGKYRLMMKARDAAVVRQLPPVQRPGAAASPGERAHADLRTLSAKLSTSGDIKDAVALYQARRSSKR